jgi:hypothetical protein
LLLSLRKTAPHWPAAMRGDSTQSIPQRLAESGQRVLERVAAGGTALDPEVANEADNRRVLTVRRYLSS